MTTDIKDKGMEEELAAAKQTKANLSLGVTGGDDLGQPMSVALGAQLGDEGDGVLVVVAVRVVQAAVPLPHHPYVLRVQGSADSQFKRPYSRRAPLASWTVLRAR